MSSLLESRKSSKKDKRYEFLNYNSEIDTSEKSGAFSLATKSAAFIRDAVAKPNRCEICGGLIHKNSMSVDHIKRKRDGGSAQIENAQLTHPFCNSVHKN